jgi:site-specific DNA-cytosine methylase
MKKLRVLIACEYSGVTRRAFAARGHDVMSCDLLESEDNSPYHYTGDIRDMLAQPWDLMIAHPPCTDIAVSGAAWFKEKIADGRQERALDFVRFLMMQDIPRIAIENPVSVISSKIRRPDQIVQPWMFGHKEQKATCLWLKGLPKLKATNDVKAEMMLLPKRERERLHYLPPSPTRWKERSRTFTGIADAFAEQWGNGVC